MKICKINRLTIGLLFLGFTFVPSLYADPMKAIFEGMQSHAKPSAEMHGNGRFGVSLGGFTYRPGPVGPVKPFRIDPPRLGSDGCGNIDVFAGSFSLMSKDEAIQVARSIMMGAANYAFDIALAAISPLSKDVKDKLKATMDALNELSINGCEKGQEFAEWAAKESNVQAQLKSLNTTITENTQFIGKGVDWFDSKVMNSLLGKDEELKNIGVDLNHNSIIERIKNLPPHTFIDKYSGIGRGELIQTFLGTVITTTGDDCPKSKDGHKTEGICTKEIPPTDPQKFIEMFYNPKDLGDEKYKLAIQKCDNEKCLKVKEEKVTVSRLLPQVTKVLSTVWDKVENGETELSEEEFKIAYLANANFENYLAKYESNTSLKVAVVSLHSMELTKKMMESQAHDVVNAVKVARVEKRDPMFSDPGTNLALKNVNHFQDSINIAMAKINKDLDKEYADLSRTLSYSRLK